MHVRPKEPEDFKLVLMEGSGVVPSFQATPTERLAFGSVFKSSLPYWACLGSCEGIYFKLP